MLERHNSTLPCCTNFVLYTQTTTIQNEKR